MPDDDSLARAPAAAPVPPTARDFLANERTFLAYMRTSLAFMGFGFVIARFSLLTREFPGARLPQENLHVSVALGVIMAVAGILVAAYGTKRYVDQDTALRRSAVIALSPRAALTVAGTVVGFGALVAFALFRLR